MTATTEPRSELEALEEEALEQLEHEAGHVERDLDQVPDAGDGGDDTGRPSLRVAMVTAMPTLAAAIMAGGVFLGSSARVYAAVAGLLGVASAFVLARVRNPLLANALIVAALFGIGLAMVVPTGVPNVPKVGTLAADAAASGDVLRPPVPFTAGWHAIVGWLMATLGFVAAWVGIVLRRPAVALLVPLPVAAIAAISVPDAEQVPSGLAAFALFAVGLGLLSSAQSTGDDRPPLAFELRRAARSIPLIALITLAAFGLSKVDWLFPEPAIDPTKEPQRPRTVPLTEVEDRVLFTVDSSLSGPWRTGSLDVYDGIDWRLPAFAASELEDVPRSGIVDSELPQGVTATFTVAGMEGAVLPTLPNTVGIAASGPKLAYDARNGNIRVSQGQIVAGLEYVVTAAPLPEVDDLRAVDRPIPAEIQEFAEIPAAPPAVERLIEEARSQFDNRWDRFDYLRTWILQNVVATGTGQPVSVPPDRVADMVAGTKRASPYEIVAAQAMMARWVGVPSRIGYGFDGGDLVDGALQIRPRHGATFVEVYFPGFKWLPVIGTPEQAQPTVGGDAGLQRFDPNVQPSDEASVQLFLPVFLSPASELGRQVLIALAIGVPVALLIVLAYVLFPAIRKAFVRGRRRSAANAAGPRARVALAYAEWRDVATDYGFGHASDTPLMFLDRFVEDDDHTELAWLVTRVLWGDLRDGVDDAAASRAEELSRSLKRRLAQSQPATLRGVAAVSRLSLRHPFAPATDLTRRGGMPHVAPAAG